MKKVIFSLALLLTCSVLGYAQKGISYQAIILDPNPIEIPGQDITGQPFVNGAVSLKFKLFSSTFVQEFEEVHTLQTDAYGMVNVLIGSQNPGAFSGLIWDSKQKTLQVLVSFDQGGTYTKVSEQQLTYNPLALFAETAGRLSETLSIAGGGTGATTEVGARTNLGLGNVDNTADANKPVSTATQNALDTKVDKVIGKQLSTNDYSTAEKTKLAAITGTNTGDQDLSAFATTTQLATKANASDVTTSLATKVDKEDGKGLSSNDYTTAEKNKLAAISGVGSGSQGPAGLPGATGPQGPAGPTGATGAQGQRGADGLPGAIGAQGPQGIQGLTGQPGAAGPQGPIGLTGPAGPAGSDGVAGATGTNGKTVANGTTDPASSTGVDGDFYINTATNMLFGPKASGAWPTGVSLVGPTGATGSTGAAGAQGLTGATGAQGIQGLTGATGATGAAGADGKTVGNGTTDPASSTGVDGDFYINTATNMLFGPKASGAWPTGGSLVGPTGATGAAGAQGIQGLTGATGAQGPQGIQGLTGATGATGAVGTDGKTVGNGTTDPASSTGVDGDFYINTATNMLFGPKASGTWPTGVSLVGPTGATGAAGAQGIQGLTGATGAQGAQGIQGQTGATGAAGADGKTVANGTTDPASSTGVDGDFYINTATNMLFGPKANGAWPTGVSLVGPTGATGATGAAGAQGPQGIQGLTGATGAAGAQGATGAAGADGKTVGNGTTDPASSTGVDGDFYINTASNMLFGPKASGVWPTGVSLVGPTGATGAQGIQGVTGATGAQGDQGITGAAGSAGATGPQGVAGTDGKTVGNGTTDPASSTGADGDFYINTASNMLFGPKASGAWPTGVSLVGPTGATGATGAAGATGATGADGATGAQGVAGPAPSGTGIVTVSSGTLQTPAGELTGDVTTSGAGLATSIATGAVTSAKLLDGTIATADIADAAITNAKIDGVAGSKVSGDISGNAANVTGTIAVANGGTGLTSTPENGQIDIGNGSGFTRTTLTAGTAITITNTAGAITIAAAVRPMTEQTTADVTHAVATATFALANTPLNAKVWMFINGVRTNNNAYTVSGTTVTYTAANNNSYTIVVGDRIQFDYAY